MELISRKSAINALDGKISVHGKENAKSVMAYVNGVRERLEALPTASKHDEFEKALVDLFAPIMECEINHPKYEDTVADIIKDVMRAYDELHPAGGNDNGSN